MTKDSCSGILETMRDKWSYKWFSSLRGLFCRRLRFRNLSLQACWDFCLWCRTVPGFLQIDRPQSHDLVQNSTVRVDSWVATFIRDLPVFSILRVTRKDQSHLYFFHGPETHFLIFGGTKNWIVLDLLESSGALRACWTKRGRNKNDEFQGHYLLAKRRNLCVAKASATEREREVT